MAKILLSIVWIIILAFIVVLMYCVITAKGCRKKKNNGNNNRGDDNMFLKKQICSRCETGKRAYELDPKSGICPHIECWQENKCSFYKPIEKVPKKVSLSGLINKKRDTN